MSKETANTLKKALASIDDPCIKLGDDAGKAVSDPKTIEVVKWMLQIPEPQPVPEHA